MRRYRRPPRRQGVVYGPPRGLGDGEGSLVGRLLGPIVIIGAFGLLAAGAWSFLSRSTPPAATPSPTEQAAVSPTFASASPSPSPLPVTPTPPPPSPTATATLPPTPSPTQFEVEVREGPGAVTFGTSFEEDTLRIIDPQATFPPRGRFYWSAHLTEAAGAPELTVRVFEYDPESGTETLVTEETTQVRNQRASIFLRRRPMQRLVDGPGIYVVRYFREDTLLAEGYFQVE